MGRYVFDYERRELTCEKERINLSGIEAEILNILIKNSPDVVTHLTLARAVWGEDYDGAYDCLKVHIRHLREKIEKQPEKPRIIITKIGAGYYVTKPS
jgi:two-component system KDP operon response regulator KdpE